MGKIPNNTVTQDARKLNPTVLDDLTIEQIKKKYQDGDLNYQQYQEYLPNKGNLNLKSETTPPQEKIQQQSNPESPFARKGYLVIIAIISILCLGILISFAVLPATQGPASPTISNPPVPTATFDNSKIQSTYEVVGNVYGISDDGKKFGKVEFSLSKQQSDMLTDLSKARIQWSTNNIPPYTLQYSSSTQPNPGQWVIKAQSINNGEIFYDLILYPIVPFSPTETMTVEISPANGLPLIIKKNALGKVSGKLNILI